MKVSRISLFIITGLCYMVYRLNYFQKHHLDSSLQGIIQKARIQISQYSSSIFPDFSDKLATEWFYINELKLTRLSKRLNDKENEVKHFIYATIAKPDPYVLNTLQMYIEGPTFEIVEKILQKLCEDPDLKLSKCLHTNKLKCIYH